MAGATSATEVVVIGGEGRRARGTPKSSTLSAPHNIPAIVDVNSPRASS
jgi:hypothetical protein